MEKNFEEIWETYVASWKAESAEEKHDLLNKVMDSSNQYHDPAIQTKGHDELVNYMMDFHQQVPGGHFVTTYFLAHGNKSIARWDMKTGDNQTIGEGISYAEYNENGMLISETGFFELPSA